MTPSDDRGGDDCSADDLDDALVSLLESYALKDERRTGWQLRGVTAPESVAAHSWGVSLLCLVFGPEAGDGVDVDRALRLAVVHDLAEARTGDVPTRAADVTGDEDAGDEADVKHERERRAVADIAGPLENVAEAWEAYEARDSETARFVKEMDLVDMCLQALVYERSARYDPDHGDAFDEYDHLDEFFATAEPRLTTDVGRRLFERIRTSYAAAKHARADADGGDVGENPTDGGEREDPTDDEPMDL